MSFAMQRQQKVEQQEDELGNFTELKHKASDMHKKVRFSG